MKTSFSNHRQGFTLVELLVVIAVVSILVGMLQPGFAWAKQEAWKARCLSNLRECGISVKLYIDDHSGRFPSKWVHDFDVDGTLVLKSAQMAMGGRDPVHPPCLQTYPRATARPLFDYTSRSEMWGCPADHGQAQAAGCGLHPIKPSNFEVVGCRYHYNAGIAWGFRDNGTLSPEADRQDGLFAKLESWAPEPARYNLMHEPPAHPYVCGFEGENGYCQWHFAGNPTDFTDPRAASRRFYSPILFIDGHATLKILRTPYAPPRPTHSSRRWIGFGTSRPRTSCRDCSPVKSWVPSHPG